MPEELTPTNPEPTTGTPSSTPAPTTNPEWRVETGPFAGKTKEEILGIATGQAYALDNANNMLQRFNQPVQQPQSNAFDLDRELPDGEYAANEKVKDVIRRLAAQGQPGDPVARRLAAQAVYAGIRQTYADDFKRWQPELDAEIGKLPVDYWTYDSLTTIVKMVRANHLDELVAEKAKRLNEDAHTTIRSGSGGSGGGSHTQHVSLDSDTLPKGWKAQAQSLGIDEQTVLEWCQMTGDTPDKYLADVAKWGKAAVIRG